MSHCESGVDAGSLCVRICSLTVRTLLALFALSAGAYVASAAWPSINGVFPTLIAEELSAPADPVPDSGSDGSTKEDGSEPTTGAKATIRLGTKTIGYRPGAIRVPVYAEDSRFVRGFMFSVDYDELFLSFDSFAEPEGGAWRVARSESDGFRTANVEVVSNDALGEDRPGDALLGYLDFTVRGVSEVFLEKFRQELPLTLRNTAANESTAFTTVNSQRYDVPTDLVDGGIVVYSANAAELGSAVVSPAAQEIRLPLYLTLYGGAYSGADLSVDYDELFLRNPRIEIINSEVPTTLVEVGDTGSLLFDVAVSSDTEVFRSEVAHLVFDYTGEEPNSGETGLSLTLDPRISEDNVDAFVASNRDMGADITVLAPLFLRGTVNPRDGLQPDISDAAIILQHAFAGLTSLPCEAAADVNASGVLDVSDAISLLTYLYSSGLPLPPPFESPGLLSDYDTPFDCDVSIPYIEILPLEE